MKEKPYPKSSIASLNHKDLAILGLIYHEGGSMRTQQIYNAGEELGMSHQTITVRLKKLREGGWLENRKSVSGDRLISEWKLTPKALQGLGAFYENVPRHPLQALEKQLSDPKLKGQNKIELIASFFRDFQLVLGACAMASIRQALYWESYPKALEQWRWAFTLLVEQQSLALLRFLHKHRRLVLKALPSAKEQAEKLGILPKKGKENV